MAAWYEEKGAEAKASMMADLVNMVRNKKLSLFYEMWDFDAFPQALRREGNAYRMRKIVLNMDHPDRFQEHVAKSEKEYTVFDTAVM